MNIFLKKTLALRVIIGVMASILTGVLTGILSGCSGGGQPNVELIQDMMDQDSVKHQEYDDFFDDHAGGARLPAENTRPVGFKVYKFPTDLEGAKSNKNPLSGEMAPAALSENLKVGQKFYETNCTVCHGSRLNGDGPVAPKYPLKIPALNSEKILGWTDGQIYHAISVGQGLMGSYAAHIQQKYRWQVVNYIRHLQQQNRK